MSYRKNVGTDRNAARIWLMSRQKTNLIDIFSYAIILVSMGSLSGLALGHATEKSMHARLSAPPPSDPIERFGLGQNAYETAIVNIKPIRALSPEYTNASYEIGTYVNGARVLAPYEPARKIDRIRLERLQDWNDQNFGSDADMNDAEFNYAAMNIDDHQMIADDVVEDNRVSAPKQAISYNAIDDIEADQDNIARDMQPISDRNGSDNQPSLTES